MLCWLHAMYIIHIGSGLVPWSDGLVWYTHKLYCAKSLYGILRLIKRSPEAAEHEEPKEHASAWSRLEKLAAFARDWGRLDRPIVSTITITYCLDRYLTLTPSMCSAEKLSRAWFSSVWNGLRELSSRVECRRLSGWGVMGICARPGQQCNSSLHCPVSNCT